MSIEFDENTSTMTISLHPDYTQEAVELVVLGFLLLSFVNRHEVCIPLILFVLMALLYGLYGKRNVRCVVKKSTGIMQYFRGGFLGTRLDKKDMVILVSSITDFEMKRFHTWGRPDQFQLWANLTGGERLDLSGKIQLEYSDCRAKAEMIKTFVNPKLSVLEFNNP